MRLPDLEAPGPPVYRQIADHIRAEVEGGALREGERLPTIRGLAADLGLNRDTVATAYDLLATQGVVRAVVGRGTFVSAPPPARRRRGTGPRPPLSAPVERLLAFESARPRFGGAAGAAELHSLVPDPALYPVEPFRRAFNRAVASEGQRLFLYGGPQGHPGLREVLAGRFRRAGIRVAAEDIVLCHGASQGIALAMRLYAAAGDTVAVEAPTYTNVLSTLHALGLRAAPVPVIEDGPDLAALGRILARPEVKAFYTIPTFHNPLGISTGLAQRRALLEVAGRAGKPVIEDAFETDLRYEGRSVAPLAALDTSGLVVHLFSFSKSLFPGVRVGSVTAHGDAIEGLIALKRATDLSDSMPLQAALADFLRRGDYDRHLARLRRTLRSRRDALLAALARHMPEGTSWTRPEGGYQVWVRLGFEVDTRDLLPDAVRAGVQFVPGSQFMTDGGASRSLRLTVAQADEEEIVRGVAALAKVVEERRRAAPAARRAASIHL